MLPSLLFLLLPATGVLAIPPPGVPDDPEDIAAAMIAAMPPMITEAPTPVQFSDTPTRVVKRDQVGGYLTSLAGSFGGSVQSFFFSGIPHWFTDLPTGNAVLKLLDVPASAMDAVPTEVLNLPAYGNWTAQGWNVRVHGNVYKIPPASQKKIDDKANDFLPGVDVSQLPPNEQNNARNLTKAIFVVQQENKQVVMDFKTNVNITSADGGGTMNARGGEQTIVLPYNTTAQGDFDVFVKLANTSGPHGGYLVPGDQTPRIQTLNMYAQGTTTGNATVYLVPTRGMTVISDIDDTLRVTKIYDPKEGILNTFARNFANWLNMPEVYAHWSSTIQNLHFHYLTTTPEQATRIYMQYTAANFPLGSFDTRPLNFSDASATLSIRRHLLDKIFETFPERKFILMGDNSNADVLRAYPALAKERPGQVQCIFIRNISNTDTNRLPYDTSGFKGLDQRKYMFYRIPDDLRSVDILSDNCYNPAIPQNLTFSTQGLPFGLGKKSDASTARSLGRWLPLMTMALIWLLVA